MDELMGDNSPAYFTVETHSSAWFQSDSSPEPSIQQQQQQQQPPPPPVEPVERMSWGDRVLCVCVWMWLISFALGSYATYNYLNCEQKLFISSGTCHTPFVIMWSFWGTMIGCSALICLIGVVRCCFTPA